MPFFGTLETGRLLDFNKIQPWPCYFQQETQQSSKDFSEDHLVYIILLSFITFHSKILLHFCHHLILRYFFKIFLFKIKDAELILSFTTAQPQRLKVLFLSENVRRVMICRIISAFGSDKVTGRKKFSDSKQDNLGGNLLFSSHNNTKSTELIKNILKNKTHVETRQVDIARLFYLLCTIYNL